MSVAFADSDQDGFLDVFVTNDNLPNFLLPQPRRRHLRGKRARSPASPCATTASRSPSMGVDFRDYDNDGLPDIFVTALAERPIPLFRNVGNGIFAGRHLCLAPRAAGAASTAAGASASFDFNNDGWKDLFTANSHVNDRVEKFEAAVYAGQ